jgi:uncharacterized protein (DUF433 family)
MKLDRITSHPNRMNGQPCIRNLRLTVRRVIELLATYRKFGLKPRRFTTAFLDL